MRTNGTPSVNERLRAIAEAISLLKLAGQATSLATVALHDELHARLDTLGARIDELEEKVADLVASGERARLTARRH